MVRYGFVLNSTYASLKSVVLLWKIISDFYIPQYLLNGNADIYNNAKYL